MNVRTLVLVLPTALLALAGCSGSQKSTREEGAATAQQGMAAQDMAAMCPMQVQGTKVEASDTDTGAALTFTTQGDVTELRRRVSALAEKHNAHHAGPGMHEHGAGGGCTCGGHGGEAKACDCPSHAAGQGQGGSGCACGQHEGQQTCACPGHAAKGEGAACACGQHEGQGCNCPMHGEHGEHGKGMHQGMHMPASRATTEEVPGGIRLVLTPVDASQLDALRESVRHHAEMMSSGQCPMMKEAPAHGS